MVGEPNILAKVKLMVDKSFLLKQVKDTIKNSPVSGDTMAEKGANMAVRGVTKGIGGILNISKKILGFLAIGAGIMAVIEPAMKMLSAIVRLVSEFVRPISDVLTMLLQPLLIMMKPIVQLFRTLMQPFRQLAIKGMAAANVLIMQGMKLGGEEGRELVGKGMSGAMSSAGLLLSGFMEVVLTPIVDLLDQTAIFSGIKENFTNVMDAWQASAIRGVTETIILKDTFMGLNIALDNTRLAASMALAKIDEQMSLLDQTVQDWSIENVEEILNNAKNAVGLTVNSMATVLTGSDGLTTSLSNAKSFAKFFSDQLGTPTDGLIGSMVTAGVDAGELTTALSGLNAVMNGMTEAALQGSLSQLNEDIANTAPKESSMLKKFWTGLSSTFKAGGPLLAVEELDKEYNKKLTNWKDSSLEKVAIFSDAIPENLKTSFTDSLAETDSFIMSKKEKELAGYKELLSISDDYMGASLIPDSFEKGMKHMLAINNTYYGEGGMLITSMQSGFNNVQNSSQNFVLAMRGIGEAIKDIAKTASVYASQARASASSARSAASSAFSAASKVKASRSSI